MFPHLPSFHDGNLLGIELLGRQVRLSLKRCNGELWEITLTGVEALHIEDFREGNIVLDFEIIQRSRPEAELLERLFTSPHQEADKKYLDAHTSFLEKKIALVETAQAAVISITPAYGADLVAFASGILARRSD